MMNVFILSNDINEPVIYPLAVAGTFLSCELSQPGVIRQSAHPARFSYSTRAGDT